MDAALVLHLLQADPDLAARPDQAEIAVVGLLRCRVVAECGGPECRCLGQVVGFAVDDEGAQAALVHGIVLLRLYRSEEHTSELQSLMRIPYSVFCLKKK